MLLQTNENLEEQLVKILAHGHSLTARTLQGEVKRRTGRTFSSQAVFKELSKLQEQGVVVRLKSTYSLSLSWVMRLTTLADVATESYLAHSPIELILAEENTKKSWRCSDFSKVSNFWLQAKVAMLSAGDENELYEWVPHPWYQILHPQRMTQLAGIFRGKKHHGYIIVGGATPLDKALTAMWDKRVFTYSHNESDFASKWNEYFSLANDYVFSVQVNGSHHRALDEAFARSRPRNPEASSELTLLLNQKAKFSVTLERNPAKSRRLKRQIREYFEP